MRAENGAPADSEQTTFEKSDRAYSVDNRYAVVFEGEMEKMNEYRRTLGFQADPAQGSIMKSE